MSPSPPQANNDSRCEGMSGPGADEDPFKMPLDEGVFALARMRSDGPLLVGFAVMLFVLRDGVECEVARVDTAHGTVHLHLFRPGGREVARREMRNIHRVEDIDSGYHEAISAIVDDYEDLIRRWDRGHS